MMEKTICELFAGVGGFRLGFERLKSGWETKWFSQWEPGAKTQWAHNCYVQHFGSCKDLNGEDHTGEDISTIDKSKIPNHTLLVGGFPCQDYSVAHTLASSKGIEGKKGVLWWQIRDVLHAKNPSFCIFENVDRLLKSPAKQRGRDFGIILACLRDAGYNAEWRVVNAADYGAAQRRRRVFIFASRQDTSFAKKINNVKVETLFLKKGFMAQAFPVESIDEIRSIILPEDIFEISDSFSFDFSEAGILRNGEVFTAKVKIKAIAPKTLGEVMEDSVDGHYVISDSARLEKWRYLKGAKKIERKAANGHMYVFSEGPVAFPDAWDKPSRTMLTSESTLNRSSHVVKDKKTNNLRIITPVEAERLQGFDDNWTQTGMPERMRYFCMGNALVVPMITRMGRVLDKIIEGEP